MRLRIYSKRKRKQLVAELLEYKYTADLSWQKLSRKFQLIGCAVQWPTLRMVCLRSSGSDRTFEKVEALLKRVRANAA